MEETTATLIAATIAAVVTIVSTFVAVTTQRKLAKIQPELEYIRHELQEKIAHVEFRRERISLALDAAINSCAELSALLHLSRREIWLMGEHETIQKRVYNSEENIQKLLSVILSSIATIVGFGIVDDKYYENIKSLIVRIELDWENFMSEAYMNVPGIKELYESSSFNPTAYASQWGKFSEHGRELISIINELPSVIDNYERNA